MENQLQLPEATQTCPLGFRPGSTSSCLRPSQPMVRAPDLSPSDFDVTEAWGEEGPPGGWQLCKDDVIAMLDMVLDLFEPTLIVST